MEKPVVTVRFDVNSLEGVPLAKKGDKLTPEYIQDLSLKRKIRPTKIPFFGTASFQSDLEAFLSEPQYERAFPTEQSKARIIQGMIQQSIYTIVADALVYVRTLDYNAYRHLLVSSALATRMAIDLEVQIQKIYAINALAPGHDIGKLAIPIEILTKKSPLNDEEKEWIFHHTTAGYILFTYYVGSEDPYFCKVAFGHHEKLNGSGYPRGMEQKDETIQIMTVCDEFNALISPRPFRPEPYPVSKAMEILQEEVIQGKLAEPVFNLLKSYCRIS